MLSGCGAKSAQDICAPDNLQPVVRGQFIEASAARDAAYKLHTQDFISRTTFEVSDAVVEEYDQSTGKVRCSADLRVRVPDDAKAWRGPEYQVRMTVIAMPEAGGSGMLYSTPGLTNTNMWLDLMNIRGANDPDPHKPLRCDEPSPFNPPDSEAEQARQRSCHPIGWSPNATPSPAPEPVANQQPPPNFSPPEQRLVDEFLDLDATCRMDTGSVGDAACSKSDEVLARLNAQGICWGRQEEARADYSAHRCGPGSIR